MTQLRAEKVAKIADTLPLLEVEGAEDADLLIVGFGGTYGHLHSAMDILNANGKKAALAHFRLHTSVSSTLFLRIQKKFFASTRRLLLLNRTWDSSQAICA